MKALTLHQPWASLVAIGAKRYETRSWRTNYSGPIAIHAAKLDPLRAIDLAVAPEDQRAFFEALEQSCCADIGVLPLGAVVATAHLWGCWRTEQLTPSPQDAQFGDFTPGRFAWKLDDVKAITPIPTRGWQGLWNWEPPA